MAPSLPRIASLGFIEFTGLRAHIKLKSFTQLLEMKLMLASNGIERILIQECRALASHLLIISS